MNKIHFDIVVEDGFVLTEVAAVVDALRVANRINLTPLYEWSYRSKGGGVKSSDSGVLVETDKVPEKSGTNFAVFVGNSDQAREDLADIAIIRGYRFRDARVVLLAEAAARFIQASKSADGIHTTHWENRDVLAEHMPTKEAQAQFAVDDGKVITCAGMGATLDLMLNLIEENMTSASVKTIADVFLHDNIRNADTTQPYEGTRPGGTGDRELDNCIELMQANMEDPLPIAELARVLQLSSRSLERKFHSLLKTTPNTYYRELRLHRASNLLLNTSLSQAEIAQACGFSTGFSRVYKKQFGLTPTAARRQKSLTNTAGKK